MSWSDHTTTTTIYWGISLFITARHYLSKTINATATFVNNERERRKMLHSFFLKQQISSTVHIFINKCRSWSTDNWIYRINAVKIINNKYVVGDSLIQRSKEEVPAMAVVTDYRIHWKAFIAHGMSRKFILATKMFLSSHFCKGLVNLVPRLSLRHVCHAIKSCTFKPFNRFVCV